MEEETIVHCGTTGPLEIVVGEDGDHAEVIKRDADLEPWRIATFHACPDDGTGVGNAALFTIGNAVHEFLCRVVANCQDDELACEAGEILCELEDNL